MGVWSDIYGYLYTRATGKTPNRSRQTTQALQGLQPGEKGANYKERGLNIQVTPPLLPYDRYRQRWDRKKLVEAVNMVVQTDPRLNKANLKTGQAAIHKGITVSVSGAQGRSRQAKIARAGQDILNQVIRDTRMNAKLSSWTRLLIREGELDLNVILDHVNRKVIGINRLPFITIMRNEDELGQFPDLERAFSQVDPLTQVVMRDEHNTERHFPLYALNSIRYQYDDGELYGISAYAPVLTHAQRLQDSEDHMFIRRMVRAGLKLLFSFFRADGSPTSWEEVNQFKAENKQLDDPESQRNAVAQNFYVNSQAKVDAIQGDADLDQIGDVEFTQDNLWVGAGVPKGLLGYGESINRDVLKEQQEEFNRDLDHLNFLLEHGDGGPYSGLRAVFDFALSIQGINPADVSYSIQWTEHTTETKGDRVKYVTELRDMGTKQGTRDPLISKRKALHLLSNDLSLETDGDIDAMLAELEEEAAEQVPMLPAPSQKAGPTSIMTPDDNQGDHAEDAPREALADLTGTMERRLRDRGRRVWRRVQEHPELHPLIATLAAHGQRALAHGIPVAVTKGHTLTDGACGCGDHAEPVRVDAAGLPSQSPYLIALILAALRQGDMNRLRTLYLRAARQGVREAAQIVNEVRARAAKEGLTVPSGQATATGAPWTAGGKASPALSAEATQAVLDAIPDRLAGIDNTTIAHIEAAIIESFNTGAEAEAWAKAIQAALELPAWRQETVSDTELAWAYHRGALDVYEESGVEQLMRNELPGACPECAADHGSIYTAEEAAGILPAHPRCYGWWSPVE